MKAKILRRILIFLLTLLLTTSIIFIALDRSGGDGSAFLFSDEASLSEKELWREENGLNRNIVLRYFDFLKSYFTLNWGETIGGESVFETIKGRVPVTLSLAFWSILISSIFSLFMVVFSLQKNKEKRGMFISILSSLFLIIPTFLSSLILVVIFSFGLKLFPVAGYNAMEDGIILHLRSLFLPSLTLSFLHSSVMMRVLREAMEESLSMPYTRTFLSMGMKEKNLPLHSAFKPSFSVFFSLVSDSIASSLGGAAVVENVFALPGLGSLLIKGAMERDVLLTSALIMTIAIFISLAFLIFDLLSISLDPRQRRNYEES